MPGLEGDLEEWQTQEVNVTQGKAEVDIDLESLPFLNTTNVKNMYLHRDSNPGPWNTVPML